MSKLHTLAAATALATASVIGASACTPINCHTGHGSTFGFVTCESGSYRTRVTYFSPLYGRYKQVVGPTALAPNYSFAYVPNPEITSGAHVTSVTFEEA